MDLSHDIELGQGPYISDAPPSPMSADVSANTGSNYMRTSSGKRIDRRLWVYVMASLFTAVMLVFSMVMISVGRPTDIWLPIITFAVGVWTGQLPSNYQSSGSSSKRAKSQAGSPTR